jgi:deoxyribodipyrimidine photolyase
MAADSSPALWWVRRDLRLADNPALRAAIDEGGGVLPLFVLDPVLTAGYPEPIVDHAAERKEALDRYAATRS